MEVGSSRKAYSKWRAASLGAVYLLMGIHIAHWKLAGTTLAPLELNEVLYTLHLGIITAGFIFMGLTLISTLIVGRFFCSWMCHILALQDLSEWILTKLKIKVKHIRSRTLLWVPFIAMGYMFVLPQIERMYKGLPAVALKVQTDSEGWASFITNDFWRNLPGIGITLFTFFICGFMIIYLLGSRSFCQYACPYGALFAISDRVAPGKIKLTGDCNQCGICTSVCSSHIQVHKEIEHFGKVVDHNCLKDLDCVAACPNDAIKFGFTKPSGFKSLNWLKTEKKHYDFTIGEDIMLIVSFGIFLVIYFGLYDSVAFLLAVPLAVISSGLLLKAKRLFTDEFSRINQFILKKSNRLTLNGKLFMGIVSILMFFIFHSSFIRYHQLTGEHHYNKITFIKSLDNNVLQSDDIKHHLNYAHDHLSTTYKLGLFQSASLLRQLAAISIYKKDNTGAQKYLEAMVSKLPNDMEAKLRLAKIYIVEGKEHQASEQLLSISSQMTYTSDEKYLKSDALVTLGHLEERAGFRSDALLRYNQALQENNLNKEALLAKGVLLTHAGKFEEAESFLLAASEHYPNSPVIENNLSIIYMKQKRFDKAQQHLELLNKLRPGNEQTTYNLAMVKYAAGNKNEAIVILKHLLNINPRHINSQKALVMIEKQNTSGNN